MSVQSKVSLRFLQDVCSLPTAPFHEGRVVEYLQRFAKERKRLKLSRDDSGNLLLELPGKKRGGARWVFAAHMDHPGFVAREMLDRRTLEADFRGFVVGEVMAGTKVRFIDDGREVRGKVVDIGAEKDGRAKKVRVRVQGEVSTGTLGMFDQGEGRTRGRIFQSRAIDDLGGLAGALAMLDQLHRTPPAATVAVLATRAEEEGFIGAIAAVKRPKLLRKDDRIVAIECSAMQTYAPQGKGPIIRVGDRTSTFNSSLTYFLTQQAEEIRKKDKAFQYQRALMPGGTCEATVYDVYGYVASSICVALGNYHNMSREKMCIGPEYIDVQDWLGMVRLFVAIAKNGHTYEPGHAALRKRIEDRFEKIKGLL